MGFAGATVPACRAHSADSGAGKIKFLHVVQPFSAHVSVFITLTDLQSMPVPA